MGEYTTWDLGRNCGWYMQEWVQKMEGGSQWVDCNLGRGGGGMVQFGVVVEWVR